MLKTVAAAVLASLAILSNAQDKTATGFVLDSRTKTSLTGATVFIASSGKYATTDETGFFRIAVAEPSSTAEIRFLGYKSAEVELSAGTSTEVLLDEDVIVTDEVIVTATRATEKSAATFSTVSKMAIQKQNFGQDLPMLLNWTPSMVTTSDAGAGIGYTGMRIRGSDATRINVTLNGIPYNDSESQGTFWVDVPDIATSTQSIQIQRGVGTSTNGAGAFGASVNLQTNVRNDKAYADVINSFGSFGTARHTVGFGSGLINNKFVFDGRFSTIKSDGYIDRASSDLKSYYLSGGYYGKKSMLKAIVFGGQEITYQSWNGVPESRLKNDADGMQVTIADQGWNQDQADHLLSSDSRTFNMFLYPNQVDNYKQDHYQLHFSHRFTGPWTANAALHYTYGRGFYEEYRYDNKFSDYGLPPADVGGATVNRTDLVRRRWLDNHFYGVTFSLNYEKEKLSSVFGGAINTYDGDHFGRIIWSGVNSGIQPDYQYYFNNGKKDDASVYWKTTYDFLPKLSGFVDLQLRRINYRASGLENKQFNFDIDVQYVFFNPKIGLTYTINDQQNLYGSLSLANREPVRDDFVDAVNGTQPKPEQLTDLEAGWRYRKGAFSFNANYYLMNYRNQLVLTGALNDVGANLRTNVDKSYRTGFELDATGRLNKRWSLGANLTLSQNKILNFTEVLYDYGPLFDQFNVIENKYEKTDIAFSPNVIAGGILSYSIIPGLEVSWLTKYVGRQYLDNTSNKSRQIDPYFVNDLRMTYAIHPRGMREVSFSLFVNNILKEEYESNGYTYGYFLGQSNEVRQNYYYPQAKTNFMGMVSLRF